MAKGKGRGGGGKNPELRGGKNNLPKTDKGTVDIKKVVKQGEQQAKKKWVDKKVVNTPKQSNKIKPQKGFDKKAWEKVQKDKQKKIDDRVKNPPKPIRPKSKATTSSSAKPLAKPTPAKGISKLKTNAAKAAPKKAVPKNKVAPAKKAALSTGISKLKATASKNAPSAKPQPAKKVAPPKKPTPSKGISKLKESTPKAKPVKAKAPVKKISKGR